MRVKLSQNIPLMQNSDIPFYLSIGCRSVVIILTEHLLFEEEATFLHHTSMTFIEVIESRKPEIRIWFPLLLDPTTAALSVR
jgi:hypothetical protein